LTRIAFASEFSRRSRAIRSRAARSRVSPASSTRSSTNADDEARKLKDAFVSTEHLLLALAETKGTESRVLLEELGVTRAALLEALQAVRGSHRVTDQTPENQYQAVEKYTRDLTAADVAAAQAEGASDADVQLAVLIASAFSMYNRIVEGFRAKTPPSSEAYRARAAEIAEHGYSDPRVTTVPDRS